jgi:hypothetical protein
MTTAAPNPHSLFERYSTSEIAARTAYSEIYLLELRNGWRPITASFRKRVSLAFGQPETTLFSIGEPA